MNDPEYIGNEATNNEDPEKNMYPPNIIPTIPETTTATLNSDLMTEVDQTSNMLHSVRIVEPPRVLPQSRYPQRERPAISRTAHRQKSTVYPFHSTLSQIDSGDEEPLENKPVVKPPIPRTSPSRNQLPSPLPHNPIVQDEEEKKSESEANTDEIKKFFSTYVSTLFKLN